MAHDTSRDASAAYDVGVTDLQIDLVAADTAYRPFPAFLDWKGDVERIDLWDQALQSLEAVREKASKRQLADAFEFVTRAAAIDTGAIEGLYEVDRGFTYSIAAQSGAWQVAMDERGAQVRPLFEAQLTTYELVLAAASGGARDRSMDPASARGGLRRTGQLPRSYGTRLAGSASAKGAV